VWKKNYIACRIHEEQKYFFLIQSGERNQRNLIKRRKTCEEKNAMRQAINKAD